MQTSANTSFDLRAWAEELLTKRPERTVLIAQGKKITAAALASEVTALRAGMQESGVTSDGIVAVSCERSTTSIAAVLACWLEHAIPFLLDPRQDSDTLFKLVDALRVQGLWGGNKIDIEAARARLPYLKWHGSVGNAATLRRAHTGDSISGGFILHSAGTNGLIRALHHSGASVHWQGAALTAALRLKPEAEIWFTGTLAQASVFALGLCAAGSAEGILVLDDPAEHLAKTTRRMDSQRILLFAQAQDRAHWNAEKLLAAKAKITAVLATDFSMDEEYTSLVANATDAAVWSGYSLAEAAGFLALNLLPGVWPNDSAGRPLAGAEIYALNQEDQRCRMGEMGRLVYSGAPSPVKVTSLTFLSKSEGQKSFTQTGDWGLQDDDDFLFVEGCERTVFSRGGFLVKSGDVEVVLRNSPEIANAIVHGTPTDEIENDISAVVVPKNGTVDTAGVLEFASKSLPRYMLPEKISIIPDFARTPTGKLRRSPSLLNTKAPAKPAAETDTEAQSEVQQQTE